MDNQGQSLSRVQKYQNDKKPKKKSKVIKTLLIILGLLIVGTGVFAAKVYYDVQKTADKVYQGKGDTINKRKSGQEVNLSKKTPFSILLLGTDTGELGRTEKGRTDTMILATVNPNTKQTTMLSIARDSRVNIVGYNQMGKINSAYAHGGVPMAINTVEEFLDVPVDYYALVNMKGLEQLVDAVGGVTVDNDLDFTYEGYHFPKGEIELADGTTALKFSRMRYDDPRGDFGRQLRQQEIIKAVLDKAVSFNMLTKYNEFLDTLESNLQTNLKLNDALNIQTKYKDAMNYKTLQLKGTGQMIDGQSYQVMNDTEVNNIKSILKTQLELN